MMRRRPVLKKYIGSRQVKMSVKAGKKNIDKGKKT